MGKELLFEIGTEEIPSAYMPGMLAALKEQAEAAFREARLGFQGLEVLGTPRRLVLHVADLAERQAPLKEEVLGPPVSAAFDKDGKPTKAALGFARTHGIEVSALGRTDTPKGERLMYFKEEEGEDSSNVLEIILSQLIHNLPAPKSMRWSDRRFTFVRPIHWVLSMYGGKARSAGKHFFSTSTSMPKSRAEQESLVAFEYKETTFGHRFMAPKEIEVKGFQDYLKKLHEYYVEPDPERRKEMIRDALGEAAEKTGGEPAASPAAVERLIERVAHLVEWPVPIACRFEERFLDLPEEVIVTTLEVNQRCFALKNARTGELLPDFVGFSNTDPEAMEKGAGSRGVIRRGYERVVRARLEDAEFYWRVDLKTPLEAMAEKLRGVVYHPRLGTSWEKVERFGALAAWLAGALFPGDAALAGRADEAARLCKADLTSGMVGEFPELQGKMGQRYAERAGREPEVSRAIFEHYLPRGEGDALPAGDEGALVGLADRMDTLAGFIGLGYVPSGSEDPYALRRAANAILRILTEKGYRISLPEFAERALGALAGRLKGSEEEVRERVAGFLRGRVAAFLSREGARADLVEAVLAASEGRGWHDPVDAAARLRAIERLAASAETFEPLTTTFKRVSNIIRQAVSEGMADGLGADGTPEVSDSLLAERSERVLAEAVGRHGEEVERSLSPIRGLRRVAVADLESAYARIMETVIELRPVVDTFFDDVLVMAEDEALRRNRLALMARVGGLFAPVADFAKIQARPTG